MHQCRPGLQPAVPPEVAARRRDGADLEAALQSRLDPIDWATYEPYLWANEQRFYGRCAVLFGSLMQLNRLHVEVRSPAGLGSPNCFLANTVLLSGLGLRQLRRQNLS